MTTGADIPRIAPRRISNQTDRFACGLPYRGVAPETVARETGIVPATLNALLNGEERMILFGNSGPSGSGGTYGYALGVTPTPVTTAIATTADSKGNSTGITAATSVTVFSLIPPTSRGRTVDQSLPGRTTLCLISSSAKCRTRSSSAIAEGSACRSATT